MAGALGLVGSGRVDMYMIASWGQVLLVPSVLWGIAVLEERKEVAESERPCARTRTRENGKLRKSENDASV